MRRRPVQPAANLAPDIVDVQLTRSEAEALGELLNRCGIGAYERGLAQVARRFFGLAATLGSEVGTANSERLRAAVVTDGPPDVGDSTIDGNVVESAHTANHSTNKATGAQDALCTAPAGDPAALFAYACAAALGDVVTGNIRVHSPVDHDLVVADLDVADGMIAVMCKWLSGCLTPQKMGDLVKTCAALLQPDARGFAFQAVVVVTPACSLAHRLEATLEVLLAHSEPVFFVEAPALVDTVISLRRELSRGSA